MRLPHFPAIATAIAVCAVTCAAERHCDQYGTFGRLPDRFKEIGRGEIGGIRIEAVVVSDGACTCDNTPEVKRARGEPVRRGVRWSCHLAAPDDLADEVGR
jgi:hypothetical protein